MSRTVEPEDFENAIGVLQRLGWHKGASVGPGGCVCAARALNIAARERSGDWCDLDEATKFMPIPQTGTKDAIARWNDASSTQLRDVQAVFRWAAERMRSKRGQVAQLAGDEPPAA